MIPPVSNNAKESNLDDQDLIKEDWMDKDQGKWGDEEINKYNEYLRREKEIQEKYEKIRSQNLTKLNNHKMDLENLRTDIEIKFIKILKKKLYYDYRITEQEMYILSMIRTQEYRNTIKNKLKDIEGLKLLYERQIIESNKLKKDFELNRHYFMLRNQEILSKYNEKSKNIPNRDKHVNEILQSEIHDLGKL